jgi:drug/metabolite transporter (DMT)-like permease
MIGSMNTASVGYLKLAVGVLIGCTLMGESLTWTTVTGLLTILLGVFAINQRQSSWVPSWFASKFTIPAARTLQ